ncbi:Protein-lysine N-methyltransferase EFM3 [Cyberlindnera fabianii]|uniref:Protein-lysine N-methyltransferase EFM3 n=1 Tax=Cyberlindnera fabianii TaxID=36022 RepID=A0A1V2L452_CYBFA|nr:Protein-lysine N-methyltransferase EFM3 [Cyberlindnera fabianii]
MDKLVHNLRQRVPISELEVPNELDSQRLLDTLATITTVNPHYVKSFFSTRLFEDPQVDQDEYYELFSEVIISKPLNPTEHDFIEYTIGDTQVIIRETPRIISGAGTTGLRTWEAALYLTKFLLTEYRFQLENKSILELGTGTGLVSLALIKSIRFKKLMITDGDSTLIEALSYNFRANQINIEKDIRVSCRSLWWGQDTPPASDIIVAADVTYDSDVIPSLVACIEDGLKNGAKEAIIAATIRNEDTIKTFDNVLTARSLSWEVINKVKRPGELNGEDLWYSKVTPEIRIYRISI